MPFTSTHSTISSTQTQADKPLDTILLDGFRQNENFNHEMILGAGGTAYTPDTTAIAHNHNGVNSALTQIGELGIDWNSAGGISQFTFGRAASSTGTTWADLKVTGATAIVVTQEIYVPSNASSLEYKARGSHPGGTGGGLIRMIHSATTLGSQVTFPVVSTTIWSTSAGEVVVSAVSGWTEFTVQGQSGAAQEVFFTDMVMRFK